MAGDVEHESRPRLNPGGTFDYLNSRARVIHRPNVIHETAQHLESIGVRRVMVVLGPRTAASAVWRDLADRLGDRVAAIRADVVPHSSTTLVESAADEARSAGVDGFLAVGGGSAADTARGVAMLLAEGGRVEDLRPEFIPPDTFRPRPLLKPKLPVAAIPFTASAAEVTPSFGITNPQREKIVFRDEKLACRLILLDPVANLAVPVALMASTSMNGLAHAVEGLYSRGGNPISDGLALQSIRMFAEALPAMAAAPEASGPRGDVLAAAHVSGMVLSNVRMAVHHVTCHALGSLGGLSHGDANSIMLPHAMRFNRVAAAPMLAQAARAMQLKVEGKSDLHAADAAIDEVRRLQHLLGVPTRLSAVGFDRALIPRVAAHTFKSPGLLFNPRGAVSAEPLIEMLEAAW